MSTVSTTRERSAWIDVANGERVLTPDDESPVVLSVVVPVYRCDDCLSALHLRLTAVLESMGWPYELLFIEDRSPDNAWVTLGAIAERDPHVRAIRLSRNFGQQAAITAGLAKSRGLYTVVMDCDLQDPPEVIPRLLEKAREGYEVVLARRVRRTHSSRRLLLAGAYHWLLRTFLRTQISGDYGAFSLISAKVRAAFLTVPDKDRHYVPILFWLGFERTSIDFEHQDRYAGTSAYSTGSLLRLAANGVFFQTTTLLRFIVYLGFAVASAGVLLALYLVVAFIAFRPPPGYTSLAVLVLVIGGAAIVSTGVGGLYIGQIFKQVKDRPIYVIDTEIGQAGPGARAHEPESGEMAPVKR
jgi:dolichol-phosphate mannosyltransferase